MQNWKLLIIALSVGVVSACASSDLAAPKPGDAYTDLKISLDRRSCSGVCPSYVVDVYGDGNVAYCGFSNVEEKGRRTRQIDPREVQALYNEILTSNFFNLRDAYRSNNIRDGYSYIVTVAVDGQTKTVFDHVGKSVGMPESVTDIQHSIDEAAETESWIGDPFNMMNLLSVETNIPDCAADFRPGAKAFRKSLMN